MFSAVKSSPGKTCILMVRGLRGITPLSSANVHSPTKSSRAIGEHSTICWLVQNSGLIHLIRAIQNPPSGCLPRPRAVLENRPRCGQDLTRRTEAGNRKKGIVRSPASTILPPRRQASIRIRRFLPLAVARRTLAADLAQSLSSGRHGLCPVRPRLHVADARRESLPSVVAGKSCCHDIQPPESGAFRACRRSSSASPQ